MQKALSAFPTQKVMTKGEYLDTINKMVDQILMMFYGLLAMSVLISIFGIINTLVLSVHERTREIGMLRAIGATRRQLRQMVRYESVITAVIGGVLGTAVGIAMAYVIVTQLGGDGLIFSLPWTQLGGVPGARRGRRRGRGGAAGAPRRRHADPRGHPVRVGLAQDREAGRLRPPGGRPARQRAGAASAAPALLTAPRTRARRRRRRARPRSPRRRRGRSTSATRSGGMPCMSFMRVAVTVGCTLTIRLSGCSSASALTKPRRPHLVAQYGGGVRDWCSVAVLPMVITASLTSGRKHPGELHDAQRG